MRTTRILLLICVAMPSILASTSAQKSAGTPDSGSLGLQGDTLGESFATFFSHHPKAQCVALSPKTKNCYEWENISIFGMSAHPDAGCSPATHSAPGCVQGMTVAFKDDRLSLLSYAVQGNDKSPAVVMLKKTCGNPSIDTPEATIWVSGNDDLSVVIGKATEGASGPTLVTFMISRA
jgi:hypothetical protein